MLKWKYFSRVEKKNFKFCLLHWNVWVFIFFSYFNVVLFGEDSPGDQGFHAARCLMSACHFIYSRCAHSPSSGAGGAHEQRDTSVFQHCAHCSQHKSPCIVPTDTQNGCSPYNSHPNLSSLWMQNFFFYVTVTCLRAALYLELQR